MPNEESPSSNAPDSQSRTNFLDRMDKGKIEPRLERNAVASMTTIPSAQTNQHVSLPSISQSNETAVSSMIVQNGFPKTSRSTTEPNSCCPLCGKDAKLLCTRCRLQKYCSPTCQKIHWSMSHKRECQSIEGRTIIVDIQDDNNVQRADNVKLNVFILKVQVALNSNVSPMIGYDYSRSVYYMINATNCKKSQLLEHTIRTTGDVQGSKAYFNAKIRARDLKLIIFLDQRHSNLGW